MIKEKFALASVYKVKPFRGALPLRNTESEVTIVLDYILPKIARKSLCASLNLKKTLADLSERTIIKQNSYDISFAKACSQDGWLDKTVYKKVQNLAIIANMYENFRGLKLQGTLEKDMINLMKLEPSEQALLNKYAKKTSRNKL